MIQQIFHRFLLRRHFWRYATFSEVAELYASRMIRMFAINISAAFISVFLYQNGYDVQFIAIYWLLFFLFKVIVSLPLALYATRFGPKHGILLANLLFIPSMIAFTLVPDWGIGAMLVTGTLQALSSAMYNICYSIDFSKVKSIDHAGKEIAYMNIVEKIATGLSPLIGGFLAYFTGPQATMWTAAILFGLATLPLLSTAEPIESHRRLVFRGFPWQTTYRSFLASVAVGFDGFASGTVWILLVAATIIGVTTDSNKVYAVLGVLSSVVIVSALLSSYTYGKLIDKRRGGDLLRISVIVNALVHVTRPFAHTLGVVGAINVANEAVTTGYSMAYTRGMFDTADLSGHRVTYFGVVEIVLNFGAVLAASVLILLVNLYGENDGIRAFFFVAAAVVLFIMSANFRLYRK
jgi:MFS family permease